MKGATARIRHILFVLAAATLAVPGICRAEEPAVGGRPVAEWVRQLRDANRGLQLRAARALSEAPAEMRPAIVIQVIPLLRSERENDRFVAAQVLGEYGNVARAAVPDLIPMLKGTQHERNRAAAAKSLGLILRDAAPDEEIERVTQALIEAFKDPYEDVRREAATACGMIGPAAQACIPHLVPLLNEPPTAWPNVVSVAAADVCRRMGPLAREHVDLLISLLHRRRSDVVPAYVLALGAIGPVQENIVPNIMDAMEREGTVFARLMEPYQVLESFGPKAAPAVDLLDRFLRESRLTPPQVIQTLKTLKAIGPASKKALNTIRAFSESKSYRQRHSSGPATPEELAEIRRQAAETLRVIGGL